MKLDKNGYKSLHEREGLRLKPYLDTRGIPTISLGVTYYPNGKKVTMKDKPLTLKEAQELGKTTADDFAKFVDSKLTKPVNQNQFNALVSIAYNIGKTAFSNSTLLRYVNIDPNQLIIADAFAMWRKNTELYGRRASEIKQYFDYTNATKGVNDYIDKIIKLKLTTK